MQVAPGKSSTSSGPERAPAFSRSRRPIVSSSAVVMPGLERRRHGLEGIGDDPADLLKLVQIILVGDRHGLNSSHCCRRFEAPLRRLVQPHLQPCLRHVPLASRDRIGAEVEDRGGQHRAGMAVADAVDEMVESADAAGGDDRHRTASAMARVSARS